MIELTRVQTLALDEQQVPLHVVDPRTHEVYVLVPKHVYDLTCKVIGGGKGKVWDDEADNNLIRKGV